MLVPDESVVPTLARITHCQVKKLERVGNCQRAKGTLHDCLLQNSSNDWIVTQDEEMNFRGNHLQIWRANERELSCRGTYRRNTCVLSLLDLPVCLQRNILIANKVMTARNPLLQVCVSDSLRRRALAGL